MIATNPVLRRELLERWRGRRAVLVLTLYLGLLGGLLVLLRWIGSNILASNAMFGFGGPILSPGPLLGRFLLENLLALVLGLVLLIAPGYAAAQLSGERERRTLGLLRITLVRPRSIVLGKLGASTAWIVLLVLASAPLAATAFVLGGATPADLVRGLVVILVVAVAVAAIALGVSSRARRTTGAVVTTYALVLVLVVGTLVASFAEFAARDFSMGGDRPVALYLNPFYALADATSSSSGFGNNLPSVLTPFAAALPLWEDRMGRGFEPAPMPMVEDVAVGMVARVEVIDAVEPARGPRRPNVWLWSSAAYLALGGAAVWVASRSLGPRDGVRES